ncbi:conserved hypothetical membrane protein [Mycoplasma suis KI3806]|uniref:Conserved hypothetical membrane protein n=1 Tax=Mycoplasma suis (strain KI_3806) TaxID=708248 RepID=F0V2P4_MYCS3|nr:DUF2179 domain-containing protein [Mycoplasma suis]CBZ40116.1 conserved hypothetical membrane protein [Mycoplasma suis KI3806]
MSSFNTSYSSADKLASIDTRKLTFKTTGGLSFQYFWSLKDQKTKILLVLMLSVFSGCLSFFFVEKVGIYSPGMFSIWQSIARLAKSQMGEEQSKVVYLLFFWVFNSIMNIVLAICTCKAIGKDMTKLSVLFIVGSTITGLILTNLPQGWGLKDFFLFSNPFGNYKGCQQQPQQENGKVAQFLQWEAIAGGTEKSNGTPNSNGVIVLFIYAIVYSILNSLMTSLLYALGGCGGGVDWIIFYLFKKKSYFANKLIFYTGLFLSFSSYTIGSYLPWALSGNGNNGGFSSFITNFFSPLFFALLSSIFVKKFIFTVFYPRFKFINVKIFTTMWLDIRKELIERKFPHSFTIVPSYGSYSLRSQTQLEFVCLLIELQELIQIIRKIDKNCFICSLPIKSLNARIGI